MGLVVSLDWEVEDPRTLFVFEDFEVAESHAKVFCKRAGLEFNRARMDARAEVNGRTFRWMWDWPRETASRWVHRYAGLELSTVAFHTHLEREDRDYLLMRMRGYPLQKTDDEYFQAVINLHTRDYNNEVSRIH